MNEDQIRQKLHEAYQSAERKPPAFTKIWAAAQAEHHGSRRRYRMFGGIAAAAAVVGIAVGLWPGKQAELSGDYLIADALLNSTSWSAPSDMLMPEHHFDVYQEIPFLIESTNSLEGSLL